MEKKFVKGKNDIEVKIEDTFKVLIRIPKGTPMIQVQNVVNAMKCSIVFIPEGYEVIVINKDGTSKKL